MTTDTEPEPPTSLARVARSRIHDADRPGVERFHAAEQLDEVSRRIAGATPDPLRPVIVLVDGEEDEPELLLASLASGRPVVPISADLDPERMLAAMEELGPAVVISGRDRRITGLDVLPGWDLPGSEAEPFDPETSTPAIGALTSGTTGRPRAHLRSQGGMVEQARLRSRLFDLGPEDRNAIFSPPSFTGALNNLVMSITNGFLSFLGLSRRLEDESIREVLDDIAASYTSITPSLFRHLSSERRQGEGFGTLRWIQLSGEPIRSSDVAIFNAINDGGTRLRVSWGSTEAGTLTTGELEPALAERDGPLPVGDTIPGVEAIVVDDRDRPVADGTTGRILVRSGNLAVTEIDDPIRARRIVLSELADPGRPWLDTADAGWRDPDGRLVVAGRTDLDLKIRGVRIDGGDIERRIASLPGVRDVVVVSVPLPNDRATLGVAVEGTEDAMPHVRAELDAGITAERHALVERLDPLPRNVANKIDRGQIARSFMQRIENHVRTDASPTGRVESLVADAWQAALGIDRPGRTTTLDELGIDSLGRLRILTTLESQHELTIPPADMANARTIAAQASVIQPLDDAGHPAVFSIREGEGPVVAACPGIGGHAWILGPLFETLRCDVKGIGVEWSDLETPADLQELVNDVSSLANERPVTWIGYSAGAAVAWRLAHLMQATGDRVSGVVLLDGDVGLSWRSRIRQITNRFRASRSPEGPSGTLDRRLEERVARGRRLLGRIRPHPGDLPTLLVETNPLRPLEPRWRRFSSHCETRFLDEPHLELLRPPIDPTLVEMIDVTLADWTGCGRSHHDRM